MPGTGMRPASVYLLDIFCTVPYYLAALCDGLRRCGLRVVLGSTSYYQDHEAFRSLGLAPDRGLVDVVAWLPRLPRWLRRPLKLLEGVVNYGLLAVRFFLFPPAILHVQYLALVPLGVPLELWLIRLCRWRGSRVVYTVHDVLPHDTGMRHAERFRQIYGLADRLICHSESMRRQVSEEFAIPAGRIEVIPHGPLLAPRNQLSRPEARARLGLPDGPILVLTLGIIKPYKGIPFLLDAWAELGRQPGDALLVVAGTGPADLLAGLQAQAEKLGLGDGVRFDFRYLSQEDLDAYHEAADILVYPYQSITTSGALLTGLARRKSIVATRLAAFEDLLCDGETACLVEYGDTAGLAGVLARWIEDPSERARYAQATARLVESDLSWDTISRRTRDCYESLAGAGKTEA
jgi:glycosyltransferase involved in cell wall biosynthesis